MGLKEKRFRILKKEKDGVTLNMGGHVSKYSWDDFNQNMEMVDKFYAVAKPEVIQKEEEVEMYLTMATLAFLRIDVLQKGGKENRPHELLYQVSMLGNSIEKVKELTGFAEADVLKLIQQRIQILKSPITLDDLKETPEEYRKRKAKEKSNEMKLRTSNIGSATESMANVKGADKLKALFKS